MVGYYSRLHRKAWDETRAFWTTVRYWTVVAGFICPIAFQMFRHGWRSVLNLADTLENGLAGLAVSLVGTYLINLVRAAKLLDSERAVEINRLGKELEAKTPPLPPIEQSRRSHIRGVLSTFTDGEKSAIKYLLWLKR